MFHIFSIRAARCCKRSSLSFVTSWFIKACQAFLAAGPAGLLLAWPARCCSGTCGSWLLSSDLYMPYWEGWWEPHRTAQQQIYDSASNHLQPHEPVDAIKADRRNKKGMKKMGGNISAGEKWPELLPSSQSQCSLSLLAVVSEARPANTNLYQERFRFPHVLVNLAAFTFQGRAFLGKGVFDFILVFWAPFWIP